MEIDIQNHLALVEREPSGWKVVSGKMRLEVALSLEKQAKVKDIHSGKVLLVTVDAVGQWCVQEDSLQ
jgi:hypothetical protein